MGELRKGCKLLFKLSWAMKKGFMKEKVGKGHLKLSCIMDVETEPIKAVVFYKDKNKTIKN
jgi:hypothetical protein